MYVHLHVCYLIDVATIEAYKHSLAINLATTYITCTATSLPLAYAQAGSWNVSLKEDNTILPSH